MLLWDFIIIFFIQDYVILNVKLRHALLYHFNISDPLLALGPDISAVGPVGSKIDIRIKD